MVRPVPEELQRRIEALAKQQRKTAGHVIDSSWYQFYVSPTCPPSTSIHIRGGLLAASADPVTTSRGRQWTVPDKVYDLTDEDDNLYGISFTTLNTFRPYLILLSISDDDYDNPSASDWKVRLRTDNTEYDTAVEAELGLINYLTTGGNTTNKPWPETTGGIYPDPPGGRPLSGLILRNDGISLAGFLAIDRVNRGQSYLFMDVRPRWLDVGH